MTALDEQGWQHRFVSANGARFHLAGVDGVAPERHTAGASGPDDTARRPLVLLLHGFPQAWWAWRHQLPAIAAAGYPALAMDLRGYGRSDKPPRGYDPTTLAADVTGVVASLGHRSAVLIGQGWGGYVAWAAATLHPDRVVGLAALSAHHPRALSRLPAGVSRAALTHVLAMQLPWLPERRIRRRAYLAHHLSAWSSPASGFPRGDDVERCRAALASWPAPHCVLEYHRWVLRSRLRADGRSFAGAMRRPVWAPVLLMTGADDPVVDEQSLDRSGRHVRGPLTTVVVAGAGHFAHEEQPETVTEALLTWLSERAATGVDGVS